MLSPTLFCILLILLWLYARGRPAPPSVMAFPTPERPLVIAHGDEGGRGFYPGNTLLYLRKMVELGVDALEIDLALTRDGQLVLIHDTEVDRTTESRGAVAAMTLAQLRNLNMAHSWSRDGERFPYRDKPQVIATIDEVFAALPTTPLVIELKNDDARAARALCASVRAAGSERRVIVSSFHGGVVREFRRLCPEVATGAVRFEAMLFFAAHLFRMERLLRPAYQTMQLPMRYHGIPVFSPKLVAAARRCRLHLSVWTVNDTVDMQRYVALGVDGLVTDRPDRLLQLLQTRQIAKQTGE
ncbi:glycerophosphodiester phosphodiesterase [Microbulbifer sp. TYP-18]|uniref:glycerophosphodiester phosphodiesterase n=1 Tax=Microbulbifer sp. TYP-18 TaxID=3230024 RepID=UPI0034C6BA08